MSRRLVAWLIALPLVAAGTWLAHCYLFAIAAPGEHAHAHVDGIGVGFVFRPAFLITCAALILFFAGLRTIQGRNARPRATLSVWPFGVLAPLGFFLHQHLQHLLGGGAPMPLESLVEPSFVLGLLLQVPLGIVTYFLARLLLRVADRLGRALGGRTRQRALPIRFTSRGLVAGRPRITVLAGAAAARAPPLAV